MSELTRKEMSKIICNHLRKDSLVDGVNETYLIASVMDALKEIKESQTLSTKFEIRTKTIDEFQKEIRDWQEDIQDNEYDSDKFDFIFERIYEIAEQLKEEPTHGLVR